MRPAFGLFLALQTQWKWLTTGMGPAVRLGLDYASIEPTARLAGVTVTPRTFDDIRTLERGVLEATGRKHGRL